MEHPVNIGAVINIAGASGVHRLYRKGLLKCPLTVSDLTEAPSRPQGHNNGARSKGPQGLQKFFRRVTGPYERLCKSF